LDASLTALIVVLLLTAGCSWVTHKPVKYHPYPSPPDTTGLSDDKKTELEWEYLSQSQEAKEANEAEDKNLTNGVRYYLSSPYLLVYTNGKGDLKWKIEHLLDQTKLMVGTPTQFFAKTTASFTFTNGVLTTSKMDSDSTAAIKAVIAAAEKLLPLLATGYTNLSDLDTEHLPPPRLYKIFVEGDTLRLLGVQTKETISVTLKPGTH